MKKLILLIFTIFVFGSCDTYHYYSGTYINKKQLYGNWIAFDDNLNIEDWLFTNIDNNNQLYINMIGFNFDVIDNKILVYDSLNIVYSYTVINYKFKIVNNQTVLEELIVNNKNQTYKLINKLLL